MLFRIFIGLVLVVCAFFAFDIYRLSSTYSEISNVKEGYFIAPEKADLEVVEFLSYGCIHCRNIHPVIMDAIARDGRIRYVPMPLLMDDEDSIAAAAAVYAGGLQGRFMDLHQYIITNYQVLNDETLGQIAAQFSLDAEKFIADAKAEETRAILLRNTILFSHLNGKGTPSFLIGSRILYVPENGMPAAEDFLKIFEEARTL